MSMLLPITVQTLYTTLGKKDDTAGAKKLKVTSEEQTEKTLRLAKKLVRQEGERKSLTIKS